jgi:hypothetical protein
MSGLAMLSLIWPGSRLDVLWRLNPAGHDALRSLGGLAVVLMATLSTACTLTVVGLLTCRRWGRWLAIALLGAHLLGDSVAGLIRRDARTLIGVPIAGAMIVYLRTEAVRRACQHTRHRPPGATCGGN